MDQASSLSARNVRYYQTLETRRDSDLLAYERAKLDAQGFLDEHLERTLTFPLLAEAKGLLQNLKIASSQLEVDSKEFIEKLVDTQLRLEEQEFLAEKLDESKVLAAHLSSFVEGWEIELTTQHFVRPLPNLQTPSQRRRSGLSKPISSSEPRPVLDCGRSIRSVDRINVLPIDTPSRRRHLEVSVHSTPVGQILRTPSAVRRSQMSKSREVESTQTTTGTIVPPKTVGVSQTDIPSQNYNSLSAGAKVFVPRTRSQIQTNDRKKSDIRDCGFENCEFSSKPDVRIFEVDSSNSNHTHTVREHDARSQSEQSLVDSQSNPNSRRHNPGKKPEPKREDPRSPPQLERKSASHVFEQISMKPKPTENLMSRHSPSCQDCKIARTKFAILQMKHGLAREFVTSPSAKWDRDVLKEDMLRLLREIERFADDGELFDLISHAHNILADVTRIFASLDRDEKEIEDEKTRKAIEDQILTQNSKSSQNQVRFKPFETPTFNNEHRDYAEFKSKFTILVTERMEEKYALLRLKTEAFEKKSTADRLVSGKSTLTEAWVALDDHFGRPSVVKDCVLKDLQQLQSVKNPNDVKGLRKLLALILSAKQDLEQAKMSHALGDSAFSILMTKIPSNLRTKIDGKIYDLAPIENTPEKQVHIFISVLERFTTIQEAHDVRTDAHVPKAASPKEKKEKSRDKLPGKADPSLHLQSITDKDSGHKDNNREFDNDNQSGRDNNSRGRGSFSRNRPKYCSFHLDSTTHATLYCPNNVNLSSKELEIKISAKKLCRLCFGTHATTDCRSRRSCPEPNCSTPNDHNKLLHSAVASKLKFPANKSGGPPKPDPAPGPPKSDVPPQNTSSQSAKTSADFLVKQPTDQAERDRLNTQLGYNTIRPSHTAYLMGSDGKLFPISVLYDIGGDVTQVTKSVLSKSSSEPFNALPNLRISSAGDESPKDWGQSDLCTLDLYDELGNLVVGVDSISVNTIGFLKPANLQVVSNILETRGNDISDLLHPAEGPIDLLIGCNNGLMKPKDIDQVGDVTGIVLAETKFGKVVYGAHPSFPRLGEELAEPSQCLLSICTDFSVVVEDTRSLETESLESSSSNTNSNAFVKCCPCVYLATTAGLRKPEKDFFDRMIAIDDQITCAKCHRCLSDDVEKDAQMNMYRKCLTYCPERMAFMTKMPWIQDFNALPDNKDAALKRLFSLTRSYAKNDRLRNWYISEFEKIIDNQILVEVSADEAAKWFETDKPVWYVAHFPVLNETSSSTPLRVVFDPTLRYKGILIDRLWERPPNMIPAIPSLLLRFRENYVSVTCDVSKAYWSLYLELPESHLHRVVWNQLDMTKPVKVYRMVRNSWGMSPSGSLCSIAMLVTAEMHKTEFPHVYEFIKSNLYVDDGAFSVKDVETAVQLARDTCQVMAKGGFSLKHFTIGGVKFDTSQLDEKVLTGLPEQIKFARDQERILGVLWNPENDVLSFPCRVNFTKRARGARQGPDSTMETYDSDFPDPLTLRQFTSVVYTHFDPLGLTTPVSIIMRHEMGLLCLLGGDWDDPIPHENEYENQPTSHERCKIILRYLFSLSKISFPRCLKPMNLSVDAKPTLVVFSDMSELACGTCVYYNWSLPSGERVSYLAAAKAKPNRKKPPILTVPRGECAAALMGVYLADNICKHSMYEFERRIFIVDSTIVLSQIANDPTKFNTWVCSRISEIQRLSDPSEFYHIESALNIADDATRSLDCSMINIGSRWQKGEKFMSLPLDQWPIKPCAEVSCKVGISKQNDKEMDVRSRDPRMRLRNPSNLSISVETSDQFLSTDSRIIQILLQLPIKDLDPHECWTRARRRVARLVHTLRNLADILCYRKSKDFENLLSAFLAVRASSGLTSKWIADHDQYCPTPMEMTIATFYWITRYQADLSYQHKLVKSMKPYNPLRSSDGLWRIHGRTTVVAKPPILISSGNLALVLLRHYHIPTHSGAHTTLSNCRSHYWIVNGSILANSLVAKCSVCCALRKQPYQVEMAPLKLFQCRRSQVFEVVAIDLCGPYLTKATRRSYRTTSVGGKVWIMVIVCAASRAVHLELCDGYATSDVLNAIKAFSDVRGVPSRIIADRGSQFVGASNASVKVWEHIDVNQVRNSLCSTTSWEFAPSGAHNFLGMAERLVASVKKTMEAVYYSEHPRLTKVEFYRMLFTIANMVNSRPLAIRHCRTKLEDVLVRPNDLLLGRSSSNIGPIIDPLAEHPKLGALIRQREAFLNDFWNKWEKTVFSSLMQRGKWLQSGRPASVGDLVLIRDTNTVRGHWSWGEVVEVHPSLDQRSRRVMVRYKTLTPDSDPKSNTLVPKPSKLVQKSVRDLCPIMRVEDRDDQ